MSGHGPHAAEERRQVQPEGVPGGLAAERPRGDEHQPGAAEGEEAASSSHQTQVSMATNEVEPTQTCIHSRFWGSPL